MPVKIRILPGAPSTGIVFIRTDLENFAIPASWRHVARVSYATSLMRQGVLISTTEHLLSVLYAMGIDNARVEIDNLEVPILDGSGLPFVRLLEEAGLRQFRRKRRFLRVRRPVTVRTGSRTSPLSTRSTSGCLRRTVRSIVGTSCCGPARCSPTALTRETRSAPATVTCSSMVSTA